MQVIKWEKYFDEVMKVIAGNMFMNWSLTSKDGNYVLSRYIKLNTSIFTGKTRCTFWIHDKNNDWEFRQRRR